MSNAQFLADLSLFDRSTAMGCREVLGEGRLLLVPLPDCIREPICYTVEAAAAAQDAVSIDLTITVPAADAEVNVYQGEVITFASGASVTLTQDAVLTNVASTVTVEPIADAAGVAAADTSEVFSVYELCSVSSLPISHNIGTENNKVLKDGIQGSTTKTCLLYTSPSPRDLSTSRMPSSA